MKNVSNFLFIDMNPEKSIVQFITLIIRYADEASIGYKEVSKLVYRVINVRLILKADVQVEVMIGSYRPKANIGYNELKSISMRKSR